MSEGKRKKKSYYIQAKRSCNGRQLLDADLKGFLITCGNKTERQAVREAYNVLNEYADKLYEKVVKSGVFHVSTELI
jgi:tRNA acetyltransferase TAN1